MSVLTNPRVEALNDPSQNRLSTKPVDVRDRLIFALDVPNFQVALDLVDQLGDEVNFYKLGLELFMAGDYFTLLDNLVRKGKKVFVDLKFFDVDNTVRSAVRALSTRGATFATVHGNEAMITAACEEKGDLKILGVTVLTSLDRNDLTDLGFDVDVTELVLSRARRALDAGADGVISSGREAPHLREKLGDRFLIITPGIRPVDNVDDQKRTVDVEDAFLNGADYVVVGRPIRDDPDPVAKAAEYQQRIAKLFTV